MHHYMAEILAWQSLPVCCWLSGADPFTSLGFSFPICAMKCLDWMVFLLPVQLWHPKIMLLYYLLPWKRPSNSRHLFTLALSLKGLPRIPYNMVEGERCFSQHMKYHPQPYLLTFAHIAPSVHNFLPVSVKDPIQSQISWQNCHWLLSELPWHQTWSTFDCNLLIHMSAVPSYSVNSPKQDPGIIFFSIARAQFSFFISGHQDEDNALYHYAV